MAMECSSQRRSRKIAIPFLLFLIFSIPIVAEEPSAEYKLKAELLERFTRFIDWPPGSLASDPSAPFVISVVGKNPFGSSLDRLKTMKIKERRVEVLHRESSVTLQPLLPRCHLLFISNSEEKNLGTILSWTGSKAILTVADTVGFAEKGVLINFYREGDYVRFEVNQSSIDKSGLKFNSRLLKLARLVEKNP